MGEQVATKGITVVDDGTMDRRRGSLNLDDEGNPTQRTVLIEDGILLGYMQDRLNAGLMGVVPTGNGRRESFAHLPMPRMTNTLMLAGEHDPAEIIASVKHGLYAKNFGGGQVDITSGKFVFSAAEAYMIEDGKVTHAVKGATLIGNGPDALTRVSMIGNDLALDPGIGTCGKDGQSVPVGVAWRRSDRRPRSGYGLTFPLPLRDASARAAREGRRLSEGFRFRRSQGRPPPRATSRPTTNAPNVSGGDQPADVHHQQDHEHGDQREDEADELARTRDELGALRLKVFGAILQLLGAFRLGAEQRDVLALHGDSFGLALELQFLLVADLLEDRQHAPCVVVVHRPSVQWAALRRLRQRRRRRGVMQHHPPPGGCAHEDVGGNRRAARIAVGEVDLLDRALHGEPDGFHHDHLIKPERELSVAGEQGFERAAHGVVADVARAARMHRHDLLVVGPRGHHRVDVLRLERLVERERRVLRRRVDRRRAALGHGAGGTNQDPVVAAGRTVRCRGIAARAKL